MEMDIDMLNKILVLHDKSKELQIIDGRVYTHASLVQIKTPVQVVLSVESLQGLVDYIHRNKDGINPEDCAIHIEDHLSVYLYGKVNRETGERPLYVQAERNRSLREFPFNRWLDHEEFMIKLYSLFQWDEEGKHAKFAETVSVIKSIDIDEIKDNKISSGSAKASEISIPGDRAVFTVKLKPYRTFSEVVQPETSFIFRVRKSDGIECALFECDGGAWLDEMRSNIHSHLRDELEDEHMPIFA